MTCRCAILLDELDGYRGLRKGRALGHIVVETRTANAVPLLRFSCSKRVIAMPTGHINARRVSTAVQDVIPVREMECEMECEVLLCSVVWECSP